MKEDENEELIPLLATNSKNAETGDAKKEKNGVNIVVSKSENMNGSKDMDIAPIIETVEDTIVQRPPLTNPAIDLRHRVLGLSQKGDWDACEVTLKMLEKESREEQIGKPLENITDEVFHPF